jgi:hypothetical protein
MPPVRNQKEKATRSLVERAPGAAATSSEENMQKNLDCLFKLNLPQ